jgi:hypothetical protein
MDKTQLINQLYRLSLFSCRSRSYAVIDRAISLAKRDSVLLQDMDLTKFERWVIYCNVQNILNDRAKLSYQISRG